jgi:hypothetical protein
MTEAAFRNFTIHFELEDAFEVSEQHLDLLAQSARHVESNLRA